MPKAFLIKKHSRKTRPLKPLDVVVDESRHNPEQVEALDLSGASTPISNPPSWSSNCSLPPIVSPRSFLPYSRCSSLPPKKRPLMTSQLTDAISTSLPPVQPKPAVSPTTKVGNDIPGYVAIQSPFGLMHYPRVDVPCLPGVNDVTPRSPLRTLADGNERQSIIHHTSRTPFCVEPNDDVENRPPVDDGIERSTEHLSITKKPPRFECDKCCKSYSTFSGLSKHQSFHCQSSESRDFSCPDCEKMYSSLGALKMHLKTHTLPCKCDVCGKAFSRPWLLQGHLRTHTGERPFQCTYCNRAFADRSNLRAHLQTHSDVKKYNCDCGKSFSRNSLLVKHRHSACIRRNILPHMAAMETNASITPSALESPRTDSLQTEYRTLIASC